MEFFFMSDTLSPNEQAMNRLGWILDGLGLAPFGIIGDLIAGVRVVEEGESK
jgi:uncharacterized membrane protein YeiH